ncbi:MAG TPA: electron transport complex subunit E [Zoogloea sp.]|uniref:electron transport complex subunit E n=1 Tax=Zoogloea sp. TaxID=49181 RepID=UPI002D0E1D7B|nr:electron transport complex subunit E [Zoogloea sp.]HMV17551.1 electron transport complex subunit E [Rhodocyclaceae bacterium]HMW52585.1 electron transport complex subunit E [Rhodocyclaceae bacterium]HMY50441.1 electron transport complex subunit E [Rhodocyclaceae bacterium]HMZ76871.1 electron transport complex subunit E [Rhodocyclaceae bacterium]HNA68473.1 electron transport complex subunit E [Rhodocyclaceae bacterium]
MSEYRDICTDGLWKQNIVFSQILGMCPTMAVTTSGTNGLGMGLATTAVLLVSNALVSSVRNVTTPQVRIPVYIVLIACLVTLVDLGINAWMHDLYKVLGMYIALIVANCAVLGRAEAFAARKPVLQSAMDGLWMGLGFTFALTTIGLCREFVGQGTLFSQASLLLGPSFSFLEINALPGYGGTLLMILPPGGFLTLGLLLAAKQAWERHQAARASAAPPLPMAPAAHCGG